MNAVAMIPGAAIFGLVFAARMLASNEWPFLTTFVWIVGTGMAIGADVGVIHGLRPPQPPEPISPTRGD
ncbi:hypothetical protein [Nocardia sp. SYP-A9097]|uniref:hypothetical protein n=1 Tax=Nocardia sp. SYP-A9097 TaxID=2663237 RepID=UPI00129B5047|nr:hypothetical protein [Nocardia sp. SYP-A9097]